MWRYLVVVLLLLLLTLGCTCRPKVPAPLTPQEKRVVVVYHPAYLTVYGDELAAQPGRIEAILKELQGVPGFIFTEPEPASVEDIRRVHTQRQIDSVKSKGNELYNIALLSAGGAVLAAEVAVAGEVSMAINRPPGHHASANNSANYCYFNNIAVAVGKLLDEKKIQRALIVDIDLHFGDGTADIFRNDSRVTYYYLPEVGKVLLEPPPGESSVETNLDYVYRPEEDRIPQLQALEEYLKKTTGYDILAVSAGFDRGREDWGRIFEVEDYRTIGRLLKEAAERNCQGKRFAVLEGGYNHEVLGKNVKAFLEGFQ